jgi:hypothetical protein
MTITNKFAKLSPVIIITAKNIYQLSNQVLALLFWHICQVSLSNSVCCFHSKLKTKPNIFPEDNVSRARNFKCLWGPGCSLAGRYDKPIPPRFLAHIDFLKIPAQLVSLCLTYFKLIPNSCLKSLISMQKAVFFYCHLAEFRGNFSLHLFPQQICVVFTPKPIPRGKDCSSRQKYN